MLPFLACVPDDEKARRRVEEVVGTVTGRREECRPYEGSVPGNCARCGGKVWIGPAQQGVIRAGPVEVLCLECAARAAPGAEVRALTGKKWGE